MINVIPAKVVSAHHHTVTGSIVCLNNRTREVSWAAKNSESLVATVPTNTPTPTIVPTLTILVTGVDQQLIILITGMDLTDNGFKRSSRIMMNFGFGFIGLGLVLKGFTKKKIKKYLPTRVGFLMHECIGQTMRSCFLFPWTGRKKIY